MCGAETKATDGHRLAHLEQRLQRFRPQRIEDTTFTRTLGDLGQYCPIAAQQLLDVLGRVCRAQIVSTERQNPARKHLLQQ